MKINQTTEALDDRINAEGCAYLAGLLLSQQAGYPEWMDRIEDIPEVNAAFQYLIDAGILRGDGYVQNWSKFGDWLFRPGEMRFHREGPEYVLKPGDFAEAFYTRTDANRVLHGHFLAVYPTEEDPYPNSLTRRVGVLDSYRVWTREVEDAIEEGEVEQSDLGEHTGRDARGQAAEAGDRGRHVEGGQVEER